MARSVDLTAALSQLETLRELVETLPDSLPHFPSSIKSFSLDLDDIQEEGHSYALNRCLEVQWGHKNHGITISERGGKLSSTLAALEVVLPKAEDLGICSLWIETFINAARHAGARTRDKPSEARARNSNATTPSPPEMIAEQRARPQNAVGLRQTTLPFMKISRAEYDEQTRREMAVVEASAEQERAAEKARKEQKALEKREYERDRKSRQRFRKRWQGNTATAIDLTGSDKASESDSSDHDASAGEADTALAARQETAKKSLIGKRTLKQRAAAALKSGKPEPAFRMNWQNHFTWSQITAAQKAVRSWSPTDIVRRLHVQNPGTFAGLHVSTLAKWIVTDEHGQTGWSQAVLKRVERGGRVAVVSRSKALANYPGITAAASAQLKALRSAGIPIQGPLIRVVLRAHIEHQAPQLLAPGSGFTLSRSWMQRYIQDELSWTSRMGTRAAKKVPADADALCERTFLRMVAAVRIHNIPADFIINADQTGVVLMPTGHRTYEVKGSKDVSITAHEEKRQMTVVVASSMNGDFLPFQSVWGGTTAASLPSTTAARRDEADRLGFVYGHGDTRHWSSRQTTQDWIQQVLVPYLARKRAARAASGLPVVQKSILLLDVWSVHIANSDINDFIPWMKRTHPDIILLFIPGGCTGKFQPADVGLQRLLKHQVKQSAVDFLVAIASRQLQAGAAPLDVKLPIDLPTLRNASVSWLVDGYQYFDRHPEVVKKSWEKCTAGAGDRWNLSYASVTSPAAFQRLQEVIASDGEFSAQILQFDAEHSITGTPDEEELSPSHNDFHDDDLSLSMSTLEDQILNSGTQANDNATVDANGDVIASSQFADQDFEAVEDDSPDSNEPAASLASTDNAANTANTAPIVFVHAVPAPAVIPVAAPAPIPVATPAPIPVAAPAPIPVAAPAAAPIPVATTIPVTTVAASGGVSHPAIHIKMTDDPSSAQPAQIVAGKVTPHATVTANSNADILKGSNGPALTVPTVSTPSDALVQMDHSVVAASQILLNVSLKGGTNPAALQTAEEARGKPNGPKRRSKKTKTGPADQAAAASSQTTKRKASKDDGAPPAKRKRTRKAKASKEVFQDGPAEPQQRVTIRIPGRKAV